MTNELAATIKAQSVRCTHAALLCFGINAVPKTGSGCLNYLVNAGFTVKLIAEDIPLRRFKFDKSKAYLLATKGHAMALVDGVLIDTMNRTLDNRILEHAWIVTREDK